MSSPVGNPPGWYQDPWQPNMQRYWDGTQWTVHQTWNAAPPPAPGASGAPAGSPAPGSPPAYPVAPPAPGGPPAWAQQGPTAPSGQPVAEWWRRLLGWIVDSIVMIPLYIPLAFVLVPKILGSPAWDDLLEASRANDLQAQLEAQQRFQEAFTGELASFVVIATLYAAAVGTAYFTLGLGRWGRTVGGRVMGIRAITADGAIPGYERAFKRYLPIAGCGLLGVLPVAGALGNVLMLLIFCSMFWDSRRQAWHDKLAGTFVVRT